MRLLTTKELMLKFADSMKAEYCECLNCGQPMYKTSNWKEDLCVCCSDVRESYDIDKRRKRQRDYARKAVAMGKKRVRRGGNLERSVFSGR